MRLRLQLFHFMFAYCVNRHQHAVIKHLQTEIQALGERIGRIDQCDTHVELMAHEMMTQLAESNTSCFIDVRYAEASTLDRFVNRESVIQSSKGRQLSYRTTPANPQVWHLVMLCPPRSSPIGCGS
jgi:hypothetical protein